MQFKNSVISKYQVFSAQEQLIKIVEDAEKELNAIEEKLKEARADYAKLVENDATSYEQLVAMEKKLNTLEKERDDAEKQYENARHLTVQDLKDEHTYETWKENR